MLNRLLMTVLLVVAIVPKAAFGQAPPPAPEGYSWVYAKPMKGIFLLPKGWNFLEEKKGDTEACFITKEKISGTQGFQTGVSINLLKDLPGKMKISPSKYAKLYVETTSKKYGSIRTIDRVVGPFTHCAVEFLSTDESGKSIHMWHIIMANDKTGSAYVISAESPERVWRENWPLIDKITQMLGVDDAI
jgi:hypothetical protein